MNRTVSKKIDDEKLTRYGIMNRLHSDQGREFESTVMSQLCKYWDVKKVMDK